MSKKLVLFVFSLLIFCGSHSQETPDRMNLLSLQEGTFPIIVPECYSAWDAELVLDDSPNSGWASKEGKVTNNIFVFEMVDSNTIEWFEFDTANIDTEGSGAKDVVVEVSDVSKDSGYETVLKATLAPKANSQKFNATKNKSGRFVRLTILNNNGSQEYTELFSFRGYGKKTKTQNMIETISGTYETTYSKFHVRQQGTALTGCYESSEGILDGAIEGRLMKITWRESKQSGPAVMVFTPDGKSFKGYWWHEGSEKRAPDGKWNGTKITSQIGGCPHWSGSVEGELTKQLKQEGRAKVYGILFDLNLATIKPESETVLEEVLKMLKAEPTWKITIEGHTDSSGTLAFNQTLSEKRAIAVKDYLVKHGISAERLQTKGFGSSKPVADNATEAGRAQNRRVELVRQK